MKLQKYIDEILAKEKHPSEKEIKEFEAQFNPKNKKSKKAPI